MNRDLLLGDLFFDSWWSTKMCQAPWTLRERGARTR